jgi:hypothetical protein
MTEPTCWVIQESWAPNADLSSAQRYGTVRHILEKREMPGVTPGPTLNKIRKLLREEYRPGDFFASTGADPCGPLLLGIALEELNFTRDADPVNWLRWERERLPSGQRPAPGQPRPGFYVPVGLNVHPR